MPQHKFSFTDSKPEINIAFDQAAKKERRIWFYLLMIGIVLASMIIPVSNAGNEIIAGQYGIGSISQVRVFLPTNGSFLSSPAWQFAGFGSGNTEGKVVLSSCDTNNDGINEIIVGQGPNAGNVIRIFDYGNATPSQQITSFGTATNAINIACGDVNNDGYGDIIAGQSGSGGISAVRVFLSSNGIFSPTASLQFNAFGSGNPSGGVVLASCDVDGSGTDEIIAGQGSGATNTIRIFDYGSTTPISQFFAFGSATNAINIACGDVNNDSYGDIIAGQSGIGSSSQVRVFLSNDGTFSANPSWQFAGFGSGNTEGKVVLSSCDTNNDGINEIIVGQGPNAGNVIRIFDYGNATPSNQFTSFGSATNGINIACGELYQDCFDNDNDGYTTCENDCNDTDVNINPGASEICDSLDNNCNGIVDEDCQFTCDDANNGIGCGNVLLMHMDELNGTIKDYSGEQNNGVESGGVTYGVSGKLGTALSFDGNDDHIIVNDNNSLDITNALTISAWVNSNVLLNTIQSIISKWASQVIFDGSSFSSYYVSLLTSNFDYYGGVFDGRYVYYVPLNNNGNVLRYDTQDNFASIDSWRVYDAGSTGGLVTKGYAGGVFDGRYVYFVPYYYSNSIYHGNVLRYDTQSDFNSPSSWSSYDASATGTGYKGGVFDGRYVYFVPSFNGNMLRYDTQSDFNSSSSWSSYGTSMNYYGGVFDGRYVYYVPLNNNGNVLRYDTQDNFASIDSWRVYDAGSTGGLVTKGYAGGVFDGRYVYFVPYYNVISSNHGNVLRYDTQSDFNSSSSWSSYDAGSTGGLTTKGYLGGLFDGRYVYFVPSSIGNIDHGNVLKYDTQSDFASSSSWSSFNASSTGGLDTVGYAGGVFDGRYVYFVPSFNGNMLRYDTTSSQASYDLRFTDSSRLSGALPRTTFLVNTPTNVLYLSLNENLPPGWNYIAASYDGSMMKLYLNGELKKSRAASGMIQTSTTPVNIGRYVDGNGYLNGIMDEVAIWNRSLSDTEILDIYNRSP